MRYRTIDSSEYRSDGLLGRWNYKKLFPARLRLKCYYAFFLVCFGCDTSYIVSVHIQFQASIYTRSLCRGYSWRVRLAKQEALTPLGHLVSPLVCRGPWMSTVVYCWSLSDCISSFVFYIMNCCCNIGGEYLIFFSTKLMYFGPIL